MSGINDFVVSFATVNGSGSASANTIFARSLFRMGIPVSPKNIFPSNIQGLPTWYEVRVSEAGWLARRDGCDLMVAMNSQTYEEDVAAEGLDQEMIASVAEAGRLDIQQGRSRHIRSDDEARRFVDELTASST